MPRARRIDFQGAFQLVQIRGLKDAHIFFDPTPRGQVLSVPGDSVSLPYAHAFLLVLSEAIDECGTELLGYRLEPATAWLLLRTRGVPLHRFMQRLGGAFSRYWRHRPAAPEEKNAHRDPFGGRYRSKIIAPEYVPHALRRLHRRQSAPGVAVRVLPELLSSEDSYLGARAWAPLTKSIVHALLETKGLTGLKGYRHFMGQSESPHIAALFEQGAPQDPGIVGGRAFVVYTHDALRFPRAPLSREELIGVVARQLQVSPEEIVSATRIGVLARSMVAWYGSRTGRSLTEIGRWFSVSAATLGKAMRHHREVSPEYFLPQLPGTEDESGTDDDGQT